MAKTRSASTTNKGKAKDDDEKIQPQSKKIKKEPKKDTKKETKTKKDDATAQKQKDKKNKKEEKPKKDKEDEIDEEEEEKKTDDKKDSDDDKKADDKKAASKKDNKKDKKADGDKPKYSSIKGYTPEQYEKYKELLKEMKAKGNDQLKEMLKKNDQAATGNKDELAAKCADGKVLGKIPRCPKCFGGRPRFDFKSGIYKCPGFRDDEDYKNCHKKYTLEELPREEWQD